MPAPTRFSLRDNVSEDARTNLAPKRDKADGVAANTTILRRHENRRDRLRATRAFPLRARSAARRRVQRHQSSEQNVAPVHRSLNLLRRDVWNRTVAMIRSNDSETFRRLVA